MSVGQEIRAAMRNRATVVGAVAGVVLVYLGWRQLSAIQAAPASAAAPAPASGATDTGSVDAATLLSAYGAGASAASSGFSSGAALGQSGIGVAGSAVTDVSGVASTLAGSQSDMGATLSGTLAAAIAALTTPQQTASLAPSPTSLPGSGPAPATVANPCAALVPQLSADVSRMQGYVNNLLAVPASRRTSAQSAALATDQATLAADQARLAAAIAGRC